MDHSFKIFIPLFVLVFIGSAVHEVLAQHVKTDAIRVHTRFLAHDLLEGRGPANLKSVKYETQTNVYKNYSIISNLKPQKNCTATDSLTVRNAHAMAYNIHQKVVVLFGGADEYQVLGDLWAWNGKKWKCLSTNGPSPRTFPALAYDSVNKELVLYGGNRVLFGADKEKDTFLNDMWGWNGEDWHQINTSTPSARAEASMVYDSDRNRMVLFGGYRIKNGMRKRLGDTWEWNGEHWELMSLDGPPPRNGTAMAYDPNRNRVILFWGDNDSGQIWEWDGKTWKRVSTAETEGRFNSAMAYDIKRGALIRFGGWIKGNQVGDTWMYKDNRWKKILTAGPSPRNHTSMVYDKERKVIVLFGGHNGNYVFGDTWEWNSIEWVLRTKNTPRRRIENGH